MMTIYSVNDDLSLFEKLNDIMRILSQILLRFLICNRN